MRRAVLINELTGDVPEIPNFVSGFKARGVVEPKNNTAAVNPTASNDNTQSYTVGSRWINTALGTVWFCTANGTGAAVWSNNTVVAGDMLKSTYDPTNINASAFDMQNMVEGATKKILTPAERTAISNATSHIASTSNPHQVDGSQLKSGAEPAGKTPVSDGAGGAAWAVAGGAPGGTDRAIQFNNATVLGGDNLRFGEPSFGGTGVGNKDGFTGTGRYGNFVYGKRNLEFGRRMGSYTANLSAIGAPASTDTGCLGFGYIYTAGARGGSVDRIGCKTGAMAGGVIQQLISIYGSNEIAAYGLGSMAFGSIQPIVGPGLYADLRRISASGPGSLAFGQVEASVGSIVSSGYGSFALGHVQVVGESILASGRGAFAFGAGAQATGNHCVQFFGGSNYRPKSVKIGTDGMYGAGGIRFLGGPYTAPPVYPANGDIWIERTGVYPAYLNEVFCRTAGVNKNLSNI